MTSQPLARTLRQRDLVAVTINAVIGAGIFGIPGRIFALTGPWSLLACLACACFAAAVALCFAEVGSRFRETGGPYLYARQAFGPGIAFGVGSLMWLARVSAFAANANLLISYLAGVGFDFQSGFPRIVFLSVLVCALAAINLLGIRNAAIVNHLFTFGKLAPLLVFICIGAFAVVPSRLILHAPPASANFSTAVLLLVYAFTGFEMTTVPGGETRDPERSLPRALLISVGIITAVYLSLQVVCIGTLPQLATSTRPLADAGALFLGPVGNSLVVAGIVVSIAGNLHVIVLSASRIPFAMAEHSQLPAIFRHSNARFRSPDFSIAVTCGVVLVLTLAATFIGALSISTVSRLIVYMSTCAALPALRRQRLPQSFRIPGGMAIASFALLTSVWLLAYAPAQEWLAVIGVLALAAAFYALWNYKRLHHERS